VRIITWNANATDRWDQLWADPVVSNHNWYIIFMQEVGNPSPTWTHVSGPVWNPAAVLRATDESNVKRRYTFQPHGYAAPLHILHIEWANRQKNHQVIITRTRPNWAAEIGADMSDRPVMGVKVRLTWPHGPAASDVLIGGVHLVANRNKSPFEINAMLKSLQLACQQQNAAGWMLVGDFNCPPEEMRDSAPVGVWWPRFKTQNKATFAIDYMVVDPTLYQVFMAVPGIDGDWALGLAASDHHLVEYIQTGGPALQIL